MSTVKRLAVVGCAGLVAATTACGSSSSVNGASPGSTTIDVGSASPFTTLDPAVAYDAGSWTVFNNIYQTLVSYPPGSNTPAPDAAKSCSFTDPTTYRCVLRSGLQFSNGDPLNAAAVKFSIDRVQKINSSSGVSALLSTIASTSTQGADTVVFHLKQPDATLPDRLAAGVASIVDPKVFSATKGITDPTDTDVVGSGLYTIDSVDYTTSDGAKTPQTMKLSINPKYQGIASADNKPQNKGLVVRYFSDVSGTYKALQDKSVDVVVTDLAPGDIVAMQNKQQLGKGLQVSSGPGAQIRLIPLNLTKAPFNNVAVRQAVAKLIDRDAIAETTYQNTVSPLYSMIPQGIADQTTAFENKYGDVPASAKSVRDSLTAAGVKLPIAFTLDYTQNSAAGPAEAKAIQQQLDNSGVFKVSLRAHASYGSMSSDVLTKNDFQAYTVGWIPDYPDPDDYVSPFLGKPGSMYNSYTSAAIQKLVPKTLQAADRTSVADTYRTIQSDFADDAAFIPIWQNKEYAAFQSNITGVTLTLDSSAVVRWWMFGKS